MSIIAPILEHTEGKIRFCVDDVEPAPELLPVENTKLQLEKALEKELLAFSHDDTCSTIPSIQIHPLVHAVHAAFSEHRPLILTPDIVWITLAQGFAQHVNNNAESLRSRFVAHSGKKTLSVDVPHIPEDQQQWIKVIQEWALHIRDRVGSDLYHLLECNFSTTTPVTQTISRVVMMDTFNQYFDYEMVCVCGIPTITLEGTIEDWQNIYNRVQAISQYDLTWWTEKVLPICQQFVETASGNPSLNFWQSIYKPHYVYGGKVITGWLAYLFPYLKAITSEAVSIKNELLSIELANLTIDAGIFPHRIPLGLSYIPFKANTLDSSNYFLKLVAGFIGVNQTKDGSLKPELGWAIIEHQSDHFAELLDKIQREHITQPPIDWSNFHYPCPKTPKEFLQLLDKFDGATLYPHSSYPWEISKYDLERCYSVPQLPSIQYGPLWTTCAIHLIELKDGRCIASTYYNWIILGKPVEKQDDFSGETFYQFEDAVIIAESIPQLFERIFAAEGKYYFDEPDFVAVSITEATPVSIKYPAGWIQI